MAAVYAVVAWLIIQIAVSTFPRLLIPAWAESFVIMCVILGFPVALILAWAFELTPEGIKTTKTAEQGTQDSKAHSKKRNWLAYAVGALLPTLIFGALALFFYIRSGDDASGFGRDKSIAVLPFENLSKQEEGEVFTNGIHSDLLTQISRIRDIRSTPRTSVMAYLGSKKKSQVIAKELGVATILTGAVQKAANQIRINVELIEAATDATLWGEKYTRDLTAGDIFEIQDEITKIIANEAPHGKPSSFR